MSNKNTTQNIQKYKQEFETNSILLNKKPFYLTRLDKNNIVTYEEKKSKDSGELYKSDTRYYGRLKYALRNLFERITKKKPEEDLFFEYKDIKPEQATKDIQKEVSTRLNKAIKEKKWLK